MRYRQRIQGGYSLIELLVAMAIGVILIGGVIVTYLVQTQVYKITNSQASIQNAENAIAALVTPVVRSAGFVGCATVNQAVTNSLNAGAPPPLGATTSPGILAGYDASGTASNGTLTLATRNPANNATLSDWTPNLHSSLASLIQTGSDVIVLLGPLPNSQPTAVTQIVAASSTLTINGTASLTVGQLAAVSDCSKSTVFNITGVTGSSIAHAAGGGPSGNVVAALPVSYVSPQLIPLQQTAFFVAQGLGGQSALMRATYAGGAWTAAPLVPGVQTLQVLYGSGANGAITQYTAASAVVDWTQVYAVKLSFLIEGQLGSGGPNNPITFNLLGTSVSVPQDGRLRRVYELTINLRNAS